MKPDLRTLGHQILDNTTGELTSLVLLATFEEIKGCTMIAGYMDKIARSLADAMQQQPEFRKAFEAAWAAITKAEIGLN